MTDATVPFLRYDSVVVNPDGTLVAWFVNALNNMAKRTGGESADLVFNALSGAAQAQSAADAAYQQAIDSSGAAFSASASPTSVSGEGYGYLSLASTNETTVTPTGGTPPYTYAWAYVSGDTFVPSNPTDATTSFSILVPLNLGEMRSGVQRCTVTDSLAATAAASVGVSIREAS